MISRVFRTRLASMLGLIGLVVSPFAWSSDQTLKPSLRNPFSMMYAPAQGQFVQTAGLSYYKTFYQVRSLLLNSDANSRYGLLGYTLDYGLTDTTTLSVHQVYAKQFQSNPYNLAQGRVGWRSPKFQISSLVPASTGLMVKPTFGLQFNPATSSGLNYAFVSSDLIWSIQRESRSTGVGFGVIHTEHKDIDGRSDGVRLEGNLGIGRHHWKLRATRSRLSSLSSSLGVYDPSYYKTLEAEWAYQLSTKTWLALGYLHETNDSRFLQTLGPLEYKNKRRHQQVTASVKWTWGR